MADETRLTPQVTKASDVSQGKPLPSPSSTFRLAFGVGCFHFGYRKEPPFVLTTREYAVAVRSALERIASINNVTIDEGPDNDTFEIAEEPPRFDEYEGAFPHPAIFELCFDLYIPYRIQDELYEGSAAPATCTEHFRVHQHYAFESPVTYVELIEPVGFPRPSAAVRVVREFLKREISPAGPVTFECIGPSPFHADFYLDEVPELPDADWPFAVEHLKLKGYDDVRLTFGTSAFPTLKEARDHLFQELDHELGVFYEIVQSRTQVYRTWSDVEESVRSVVDLPEGQPWPERLKSYLTHGGRVRATHTALVRLEAMALLRRTALERNLRATYAIDEATFLEPYVQTELSEWPVLPTEQLAKLVTAVEERRSRAVEFAVVLLAAVIGGIAGAWASGG